VGTALFNKLHVTGTNSIPIWNVRTSSIQASHLQKIIMIIRWIRPVSLFYDAKMDAVLILGNIQLDALFRVQWKPLIMITLGPALFYNNSRLITLSGGYKNLRDLNQFVVTTFYVYKKQQNLF
jgi:hypothetical protein